MHCPYCHNADSRVVDTRIADDGASIRRRRECSRCKRRFTTLETSQFQVTKRSGVIEPFSRDKVVAGLRRACQGRPVSEPDLALLAQQVEERLRSTGASNVSSEEVGKAILPYLADLDQVAYLRFASVYRGFKSLDDFEAEIRALRAAHPSARGEAAGPDGPEETGGDAEPSRAGTTPRSPSSVETSSLGGTQPGRRPTSRRRRSSARRAEVQEATLLDD